MNDNVPLTRRCSITVELSVSAQMFRRHDWLEGEALAGEVEMDVVDAYVEQRWQAQHDLVFEAGKVSGRCTFERPMEKMGCTIRCVLLVPLIALPCAYEDEGVAGVANVLGELSITCTGAEKQIHSRGSYMEMLSINAYPVPRIVVRVEVVE